jgi:hypothetical protein
MFRSQTGLRESGRFKLLSVYFLAPLGAALYVGDPTVDCRHNFSSQFIHTDFFCFHGAVSSLPSNVFRRAVEFSAAKPLHYGKQSLNK